MEGKDSFDLCEHSDGILLSLITGIHCLKRENEGFHLFAPNLHKFIIMKKLKIFLLLNMFLIWSNKF